jgi:hypothetical protein
MSDWIFWLMIILSPLLVIIVVTLYGVLVQRSRQYHYQALGVKFSSENWSETVFGDFEKAVESIEAFPYAFNSLDWIKRVFSDYPDLPAIIGLNFINSQNLIPTTPQAL